MNGSSMKNSVRQFAYLSPNFTGGEQSEIWHQLLTPVAFESSSFKKQQCIKIYENVLSVDHWPTFSLT